MKNLLPAVANGRVVRELAGGPPGPGPMSEPELHAAPLNGVQISELNLASSRRVHRGPVEDAVQHANLKCAPTKSPRSRVIARERRDRKSKTSPQITLIASGTRLG